MATRCNIVIRKGEDQVIVYRHWGGYPSCTGIALVKNCRSANFDPIKIFRYFAESGAYELSRYKHGDADYEYLVDLDKKQIYAEDLKTKEVYDEDDFYD